MNDTFIHLFRVTLLQTINQKLGEDDDTPHFIQEHCPLHCSVRVHVLSSR